MVGSGIKHPGSATLFERQEKLILVLQVPRHGFDFPDLSLQTVVVEGEIDSWKPRFGATGEVRLELITVSGIPQDQARYYR
jgi:hypothetical protein